MFVAYIDDTCTVIGAHRDAMQLHYYCTHFFNHCKNLSPQPASLARIAKHSYYCTQFFNYCKNLSPKLAILARIAKKILLLHMMHACPTRI